jgi:1-acyl-sn-glycerol-3-phosphate acyltransferase
MQSRALRWVFDKLMGLLTRRRVEGWENLPPKGPYIFAANHLHLLDAPLLYGLVGGDQLGGWAAEKWENDPFIGTILKLAGATFIRRGAVDREAISAAVDWLKAGKIFGIAPEGTRSHTGGLIRGKSGIAYIAHEAGVPIVPIGHFGTEKIWSALAHLRRQPVTVRIGKPFLLPPLDAHDRAASLRQQADEVMCRIAFLLPAEYRGIYATHPRLQELLREGQANST